MNNSSINNLNKEQKEQVLSQWQNHKHKRLKIDIELSGHGEKLEDFVVAPGVWNPGITSARYYASYLFYSNERLFKGKSALDVGTGTGILGIIMAMNGAKTVVLSDVSLPAVKNAEENIKKYGLADKARVIQSDLFDNVEGQFDLIVFNHPFFSGNPPESDTIAASMLAPESLIQKFLIEAPKYLRRDGKIIMPFYTKAGKANDPSIQAPKFGFDVTPCFKTISHSGLQKGEISIFELYHKK